MNRARPTRRIVSVWFPDLAMDRWRRLTQQSRTLPGNDVPVVLSCDGPHGPVIHALSHAARDRAIRSGARVVDAQAIHPDLHVEPADPEGDVALLDRLALWSRRWSPWTVRDGGDGILLDATGAAHLFGGEAGLLANMRERFALQGLQALVALAPTSGAARALARFATCGTICGANGLTESLAPLPVAALGLDHDMTRLLDRLGLKTLGALEALPRETLMRRFGAVEAGRNPLILLDRAMGRAANPLNAPPDVRRWLVRSRLAEPVMEVAPHLGGLIDALCRDLAATELGARLLRLTIYRVDGEWRSSDVATARASRDPDHLLRLLDGRLDRLDPGFGLDVLTLEALRTEPLAPRQEGLDGTRDPEADVTVLLDRLTAWLGRDRVHWSVWKESHLPERLEGRVPSLGTGPTDPPDLPRERPIRLLDPAEEVHVIYAVPEGPPARFLWRGAQLDVLRHEGPERIAPEWWRDRPGTRLRDYYKVEVADGRRFWLYREGVVGDKRGGAPRWFLHGAFA